MSFPSSPTLSLPEKEIAYLRALTVTIRTTLVSCLKAVYLFGSASYGAYQPGTSDLDLSIVITSPLPIARYQSLASAISHAALPCPARKLELVLYTYETVKDLTRFPKFEMNFNTGMGMDDHLVFDSSNEAGHWFLLDLAAGRQLGVPLLGPAPQEVIGNIKQELVFDALREGLEWWGENASASPDAVLNACRAWRWIDTGLWGSKLDGAKWVLEQREEPDIISTVNHAVELRSLGGALDMADALRMIDIVRPIFLTRHTAKEPLSMHGLDKDLSTTKQCRDLGTYPMFCIEEFHLYSMVARSHLNQSHKCPQPEANIIQGPSTLSNINYVPPHSAWDIMRVRGNNLSLCGVPGP